MIDPCCNCGKPAEFTQRDWDAVCVHCGQLLWLRPGDIVECKMARQTHFGIIVEVGEGLEGLIHVSELPGQNVPGYAMAVGSLIRARVVSIDFSRRRIGLSCR